MEAKRNPGTPVGASCLLPMAIEVARKLYTKIDRMAKDMGST